MSYLVQGASTVAFALTTATRADRQHKGPIGSLVWSYGRWRVGSEELEDRTRVASLDPALRPAVVRCPSGHDEGVHYRGRSEALGRIARAIPSREDYRN